MPITYAREDGLGAADFIDVLQRAGLAGRPVDDRPRIAAMLANADLIVTARADGRLVGVARSLSDFAYCCYLSDLAVDRAFQRRGIGRRLIEETRREAGPQSMCLLIAAPEAVSFYRAIGMPASDRAFLYPRER